MESTCQLENQSKLAIEKEREILLSECSEGRFFAYGTAKIFQRRANRLRKKRTVIAFLGILVPVLVGTLVLSFGVKIVWIDYVVYVAGILSVIQFIFSVWSMVDRWDEKYEYSVSAIQSSTNLFHQWNKLAKYPPDNLKDEVNRLKEIDARQESADLSQNITPEEQRYAMCEALIHFRQACRVCHQMPPTSRSRWFFRKTCHCCGQTLS